MKENKELREKVESLECQVKDLKEEIASWRQLVEHAEDEVQLLARILFNEGHLGLKEMIGEDIEDYIPEYILEQILAAGSEESEKADQEMSTLWDKSFWKTTKIQFPDRIGLLHRRVTIGREQDGELIGANVNMPLSDS